MTWYDDVVQHGPYALPALVAVIAVLYISQKWGGE